MKKIAAVILLIILICVIAACDSSSQDGQGTQSPQFSLTDVETVIANYNEAATAYNKNAQSYNEVVSQMLDENDKLSAAIAAAQQIAESGEIPLDSETLTSLIEKLEDATQALISEHKKLPTYDLVTMPSDLQSEEYEAFCKTMTVQIEEIAAQQIPDIPEIPDYSNLIGELETASNIYLSSVQSMKQVTTPEEDFVIDRLKRIDHIVGLAAVTKDHDPNKLLGTEGGYISCLYFSDSRVDKTELNIPAGKNNVIDIGTVGGGSIEVFSSVEDAVSRNEYLSSFDGTTLNPGAHTVVGTLVIRVSSKLTVEQQEEMTNLIISVLTSIE